MESINQNKAAAEAWGGLWAFNKDKVLRIYSSDKGIKATAVFSDDFEYCGYNTKYKTA